jgi:hypothetical protein
MSKNELMKSCLRVPSQRIFVGIAGVQRHHLRPVLKGDEKTCFISQQSVR